MGAGPLKQIAAKAIAKLDSWQNVLTGLGTLAKDKRMSASFAWERMTESMAEEFYASDDIAAMIVDAVPEDSLRNWFTVNCDEIDGIAATVDLLLDSMHFATALLDAWTWARLHGGSAILMVCDDSKQLSEPLIKEQNRELKNFVVLTRWDLIPDSIDADLNSKTFGEPLTYRVTSNKNDQAQTGIIIHHSRLLRFDGVKLPPRTRIRNNYWGDSVLTRAANPIRNYQISNDAVASILQEVNQPVFKLKNLAEMLMQDEDEKIIKRLQIINMSRSICRAIVIDETEKFESVAVPIQGLADLLRTVAARLVSASRMPHTKLLGESPSGLGATGESEKRDWDDFISNQQEKILRPHIKTVLEILFASRKGPTSGKVPKDWSFEFAAMNQPSEKEMAEVHETQARADKIYLEAGVIDAEEVAASRFGTGRYSLDTRLEAGARKPIKPVAGDE